MVSSPGDAAVGSPVWRPCFRSRKDVSYLALRSRGVTALGLVWIGGEVVPPRAETARAAAQKPPRAFTWWIPGSSQSPLRRRIPMRRI